jgi:hypothetical protein
MGEKVLSSCYNVEPQLPQKIRRSNMSMVSTSKAFPYRFVSWNEFYVQLINDKHIHYREKNYTLQQELDIFNKNYPKFLKDNSKLNSQQVKPGQVTLDSSQLDGFLFLNVEMSEEVLNKHNRWISTPEADYNVINPTIDYKTKRGQEILMIKNNDELYDENKVYSKPTHNWLLPQRSFIVRQKQTHASLHGKRTSRTRGTRS